MKNFYEYLEQLATKSFVDDNIINNNNNDGDDDGDGDGDDDEYEWDKLSRYDDKLIDWVHNDPYAKKINNAILELIFKKGPYLEIKDYFGDDDNEINFSSSGEVILEASWRMPVDSIEDKLYHTLRSGTVWKAFNIQPNELWNFIDKGDVFEYIYYHIKMSLLGINKKISDKHYNFDQEYFLKHKDWVSDKQTLEKYGKFMMYMNNDKFTKFVEDFFPFEVELEKTKESVRSLIYKENFDITGLLDYRYQKI